MKVQTEWRQDKGRRRIRARAVPRAQETIDEPAISVAIGKRAAEAAAGQSPALASRV
jgi:hypothetical protein